MTETNANKSGSLREARILVVEDNFLIATDITQSLHRRGAVVLGPVPDLQSGLAIAKRDRPDAAVLDVSIVGGTSTPIAEALLHSNCPYVFLTGYTSPGLADEHLNRAAVLTKPVQPQDLVKTLYDMLQRHA